MKSHRETRRRFAACWSVFAIASIFCLSGGCGSGGKNNRAVQQPSSAAAIAESSAFTLFPTDATVRLTGPTAEKVRPAAGRFRVVLCRGGSAAFEVMAHRHAAKTTAPPASQPAWSAKADITIPGAAGAPSIITYQVLSVHFDKPNPGIPAGDERTGWTPDVCLRTGQGRAQPQQPDDITFLFDVHAPKMTGRTSRAQTFPFQVRVTDSTGGVQTLPVDVVVYPYELPTTLPFHTGATWNWKIETYLGRKLTDDERMRFFDFFLDFHLTPTAFFSKGPSFSESEIRHIVARGGNVFQVFFQGGDGARLITDQQRQKLTPEIRQWRELMNSCGAGDYCYALIGDEPKETAFPTIRSNATWLKSLWPEAKIWVATRPNEQLLDLVDLWDVVISASSEHYGPHSYTRESYELARHAPHHPEIWWFVSKEPYPPKPNVRLDNYLADSRAIGPMSYGHGMQGFEYTWATDWSPNARLRDVSWPDKAESWDPGDAGVGLLCYPGDDGMPMPSLRLFALRDGLEDWALLKAAGEKVTPEESDGLRSPAALAALREKACRDLAKAGH